MISPYLTRPLRSLDEALRDRGPSTADVGSADTHGNRGEVLAQLLLSATVESGHPAGASAVEADGGHRTGDAPGGRHAA